MKSRFLKRVLNVSKRTPSRLAYVLARETFLMEDVRFKILLPSTTRYKKLLQELQEKRIMIWSDFYTTDAMINREWTRGGYD